MELLRLVLLPIVLVSLCPPYTTGKVIPVLQSVNSTFNSKLLNGTLLLHIPQGRRGFPLLNISLCSDKPVTEAWLHATVSVVSRKGRLHAPIYDSRVDFCELLSQPHKHHLMSLIYNEIRRYGRIPRGCPIQPACYVYNNISLERTQLPSFLSEADFQANIVGYASGNEQYTSMQFIGSLKKV